MLPHAARENRRRRVQNPYLCAADWGHGRGSATGASRQDARIRVAVSSARDDGRHRAPFYGDGLYHDHWIPLGYEIVVQDSAVPPDSTHLPPTVPVGSGTGCTFVVGVYVQYILDSTSYGFLPLARVLYDSTPTNHLLWVRNTKPRPGQGQGKEL